MFFDFGNLNPPEPRFFWKYGMYPQSHGLASCSLLQLVLWGYIPFPGIPVPHSSLVKSPYKSLQFLVESQLGPGYEASPSSMPFLTMELQGFTVSTFGGAGNGRKWRNGPWIGGFYWAKLFGNPWFWHVLTWFLTPKLVIWLGVLDCSLQFLT